MDILFLNSDKTSLKQDKLATCRRSTITNAYLK